MKYKWYSCDAITGTEDTFDEAVERLNSHLPFDITDISECKTESTGTYETITYYYPDATPDEDIQNDDGAYTPQIQEIYGDSDWDNVL